MGSIPRQAARHIEHQRKLGVEVEKVSEVSAVLIIKDDVIAFDCCVRRRFEVVQAHGFALRPPD